MTPNGLYTDIKELLEDTSMGRRPHVVILGAGASLAAFPQGDINGNSVPVMSDLVKTVGLSYELDRNGIIYKDKNFEDIYSELYENERNNSILEVIHNKIWDYFNNLALPSYPTIYDHLVLSLRDKDLIATFNWDPFLYHACWRNHKVAKLPHVVYLHGNVSVGYCPTDMQAGLVGTECSVCNNSYLPSKLLFPIKQKDYNQDIFIKAEWESLKFYLKRAYMITIFGYGAPQSDIEAIELMKDAWGSPWIRNLEQIEIIDVKEEEVLRDTWNDFIHTHHYKVTTDFYQSFMGLFPRRTCEAEWNYSMPEKPEFYPQNPIPKNLGFKELWEWYDPLVEIENMKAKA